MQIIIDQEKMLHDFKLRNDGKTAISLLHSDFMEIGYSGKTYIYDSYINSLNKELKPDYKLHSQDFYITEFGDNLIQILYKTANINSDGYINQYAKRSSIWVLKNDTWKIRYHQVTPSREFEIQT